MLGGNQWPGGTEQLVRIHTVSQNSMSVESTQSTPSVYRIPGWIDNLNSSRDKKELTRQRDQAILLSISFRTKGLIPSSLFVYVQYAFHSVLLANCLQQFAVCLQIRPLLLQSWYQSQSRLYMLSIFCWFLSSTQLVCFPHYWRFRKSWLTSVLHHLRWPQLTSRQ